VGALTERPNTGFSEDLTTRDIDVPAVLHGLTIIARDSLHCFSILLLWRRSPAAAFGG